jgi:hypothetical protein
MYGMVNKAIEDLVTTRFGAAAWAQVKQRAGVEHEVILSMDPYPDDLTYRLVDAASEVLDLPADTVLEAFGEHWTLYTAQEGYGEMLRLSGDTLLEFLHNLDELHARVGLIFPQLRPPSFRCTHLTGHSLHLHYYSQRQGLAPMVFGLIKGLGAMFGTPTTICLLDDRSRGADHDVFLVEYGPA